MGARDTHMHCRVTASQRYQPRWTELTPPRTGQMPLGSRGISNSLGKATVWVASGGRAVSTDLLVVVRWHVALSVVHHCYLLAVPGIETRSIHRTRPAPARLCPNPPAPRGLQRGQAGNALQHLPLLPGLLGCSAPGWLRQRKLRTARPGPSPLSPSWLALS